MKQSKRKLVSIEDPLQVIQELYSPFAIRSTQHLRQQIKKTINTKNYKSFKTLSWSQDEDQDQQVQSVNRDSNTSVSSKPQVELNVLKQINLNTNMQIQEQKPNIVIKDSVVSKIFDNMKKPKNQTRVQKEKEVIKLDQDGDYFGFNNNFRVAYPQTPGFKSLLQSPFGKFNNLFKEKITTLTKQYEIKNDYRLNFQIVEIDANPLLFYNKQKCSFDGGKYFIGMALKMKQQNYILESLYLFFLACYVDPFNDKTWRKYISILQEQGKLSRACAIAKTGFLLTQNEQLIKNFLLIGEKCGMEIDKIQGIMCSISNPELLQKTLLPQSAKLQIKYGVIWKGLKLLWQICKINDYKLSVCLITLYLARYLQNLGYCDKAMAILKQSFTKSMSKLQIYLLYLQISLRKNKCLVQADLQQVLKYLDYVSGQNKYRLLLQIAEMLYKNNDQRYYLLIGNAYKAAIQFCAPGAGNNKALKQIYYTLAKMKGIMPNVGKCRSDSIIFQLNRYRFINGYDIIEYQFEDWKYYLHYGVVRKFDLLVSAAKKWPLTGRIIAQWIHSMRLVKSPLQILKVWREKIEDVPKSGQLWCQGGRIYVQLGQQANAQKCFRCAMHFTPQYGDSFFEELRLLLKNSRFLEIQKLKKLFLASQPFYGHVLSYIKLNHWQNHSLSLKKIWQNALYSISQDLYRQNIYLKQLDRKQPNKIKQSIQFFTAYPPYNYAFSYLKTKQERQKLFISYQQMQNKN